MTIKHLFPTAKPVLDLNFARTRQLDPRITFTRASTGTYVDSRGVVQTAAIDEPRFDHSGTGESLGLLIEEARTNLFDESQDVSTWSQASFTNTANSTTAPDGTLTGGLIVPNAGTTSQSTGRNCTTTSGTVYSASIYAKAKEFNEFRLRPSNSNSYRATFLLSGEGSFTDVIGGTATIKSFSDGWYLCTFTFTEPTGGSRNCGVQTETTGDGTSGFYVWGMQLEAGFFSTSYVPTAGATVARSADVAAIDNSGGIVFNPDQFTLINEPFGRASGSHTVTFHPADPAGIQRVSAYSQYLPQEQINAISRAEDDGFWRWRIDGSSFALPSFTTDGQVTVDWGDGVVEVLTTAEHTFQAGGQHEVGFRLDSGTNFKPYINNGSHAAKVVAVGPAPESMRLDGNRAFYGCSNLAAFDATVGLGGTSFYRAWRDCSSLTSFPFIDTSGVTDFTETWFICTNLTSFPLIDTSSVDKFINTWGNCYDLASFPLINTSLGTTFNGAWFNCSSLTSFPLIDTSSGTIFSTTWQGCSGLTSFPLIDTSLGTAFNGAWRSCSSLTSFPLIDTSSGTNFRDAWHSCSGLTSFPLIDTSSGDNFFAAWQGCSDLTSFPSIDTSSGTVFNNAWRSCSSLTSFPLLNTSLGENFSYAWEGCSSLTSFPANFFDSWTGTPANDCFFLAWSGCSLSATSVENILNSIDTSGQSAPASGVDITIDYDAGTGTPSVATAVTNLKARGWTITLNGVPQ